MAVVSKISRAADHGPSADEMIALIDHEVLRLQAFALSEEKAGRLSDETIRTLDEIGVYRISFPLEYGGLAYSTEDQRRVYSAVGKIAGSTGWVGWVTTTHGRWVAMFSKAAQDEVYGMDWVGPRISGVLSRLGPARPAR